MIFMSLLMSDKAGAPRRVRLGVCCIQMCLEVLPTRIADSLERHVSPCSYQAHLFVRVE